MTVSGGTPQEDKMEDVTVVGYAPISRSSSGDTLGSGIGRVAHRPGVGASGR